MKYREAQEKSVSGVAVLGNIALMDVIWPKNSPHPYMFLANQGKWGYVPIKEHGNMAKKDVWEPLHPLREDIKLVKTDEMDNYGSGI